ncbi:MAG: GxxExxY protein [Fulvivirga sp.]
MKENDIATEILAKAFAIHTALGPGLLESVYERALYFDLVESGLTVQAQLPVPMVYKDINFESGFRLDLLVEDKVIVEIKAIETLAPVHFAQTLTYLKLSDKRLGLLINFNVKWLKNGVHRVVNNL